MPAEPPPGPPLPGTTSEVTTGLPLDQRRGTQQPSRQFGVTAGTAVACSADRRWLAVPAVTACAAAGSLAADRLRWHPFGPILIVFGSAALSSVTGVPARIPVTFAVAAIGIGVDLVAYRFGPLAEPRRVPARAGS